MTTLHFIVPVAASPQQVEVKLSEAAKDPTQFVHLFTTSPDIDADVAEGGKGLWRIRVEGPQFRSKGTVAVLSVPDGSDIEIQIDLRGKGFLALAGPVLGLAAGKVEGEATKALQNEFGERSST